MPGQADPVDAPVTLASSPAELAVAGRLLHDFNTEFDEPTPRAEILASRLAELLGGEDTEVLLVGGDRGVAVLRFRAALWSAANECYLAELYVGPGSRGKAFGRALLKGCVDRARARGCDFMDLSTNEDDVAARHLYESEGFRRTEGGGGPLMFHYEREV